MLSFPGGVRLPNPALFLSDAKEVHALRQATHGAHPIGLVHGDLHGDNIMVDSMNNRFLIDFDKVLLHRLHSLHT